MMKKLSVNLTTQILYMTFVELSKYVKDEGKHSDNV